MGLFNKPKRKLRKMVRNGDYREAVDFGLSMGPAYSEDPDYLFIMGGIYYILEDAKSAMYYLDRALGINSFDTEALYLKACVHAATGEAEPARSCCQKVLEIDPEHMQARQMLDGMG